MRTWLVLPVALGAALGCKELPEIPAGVCGNLVVEPPEDCDGFARDGVPCHAPGGVDGCRLDCSPDGNGVASQCPSGWGCSEGSVCRPATGRFGSTGGGATIPGTAWSLLAGDFDGDGHRDIVSIERPLALGVTKARIHYFGDQGVPLGTYVSEKQMISPIVGDITHDSRSDITYAFGSVFVLSGERNRSLLTETYPSYFLGDSPGRALFVTDGSIEGEVPIAVFATLGSTNGIFVFDAESSFLRPIAELDGGVEDLASEPVLGDIFESHVLFPCDEIVFGYRGATKFSVYSLCESGAADEPLWREEPHVEAVTLDPPVPIERIVLADVDGDGHLDALVGTKDGPYVAYGDGAHLGVARRHTFTSLDGSIAPDATPLVGKDITADGLADFVFPEGLALSAFDPATGATGYVTTRTRFGLPWSEAGFGDLNADGNLDVVCASNQGLDIDLFSGTSSFEVNNFTISTTGATEHLLVRDLDGDFVDDLAFSEIRDSPNDEDQLSIAFGRQAGGPEPPVVISYLEAVDQIVAFDNDPSSAIANMMVLFSQSGEDGGREHAIGLMVGSSDRSPASPIELTTFAADGAVLTSTSVAVTVGAFRDARQTDALTFALAPTADSFEEADTELWLVQDITNKSHGPEYLGWDLDPRSRPLGGPNSPNEVSARLAARDLDGDAIDELVFVAPSEDGEQCIVNVAGIVGEPPVLELDDVVAIDATCFENVLELVDLDDDGAPEIVLLTGEEASGPRRPLVLWNDGKGDFSADRAQPLESGGEDTRAFTTFTAHDGKTTLAVVTERTVRLVRPLGASRSFDYPDPIATTTHGTGIVATDVNGDGIVDLAVADGGAVRILHAELAR